MINYLFIDINALKHLIYYVISMFILYIKNHP